MTTTNEIKVNVTQRFDRDCKVFAFNVLIDGELHEGVSKNNAAMLVIQAEEVARDLGMGCNVYGQHYLVH